jgi:hypothetical protein
VCQRPGCWLVDQPKGPPGLRAWGASKRGLCGTCRTREAVGTVCRIKFRARRRFCGLSLALAQARLVIGIAQPPKRVPVTPLAPVKSAPAAAAVAPAVAAPEAFASAARPPGVPALVRAVPRFDPGRPRVTPAGRRRLAQSMVAGPVACTSYRAAGCHAAAPRAIHRKSGPITSHSTPRGGRMRIRSALAPVSAHSSRGGRRVSSYGALLRSASVGCGAAGAVCEARMPSRAGPRDRRSAGGSVPGGPR